MSPPEKLQDSPWGPFDTRYTSSAKGVKRLLMPSWEKACPTGYTELLYYLGRSRLGQGEAIDIKRSYDSSLLRLDPDP